MPLGPVRPTCYLPIRPSVRPSVCVGTENGRPVAGLAGQRLWAVPLVSLALSWVPAPGRTRAGAGRGQASRGSGSGGNQSPGAGASQPEWSLDSLLSGRRWGVGAEGGYGEGSGPSQGKRGAARGGREGGLRSGGRELLGSGQVSGGGSTGGVPDVGDRRARGSGGWRWGVGTGLGMLVLRSTSTPVSSMSDTRVGAPDG